MSVEQWKISFRIFVVAYVTSPLVKKNPFSSSFIRFFIFALRGTLGSSLILKAQQIDTLPEGQQLIEIQKLRSRKEATSCAPVASPASIDDLDQSISHFFVSPFLHAAAALSHGDKENQGLSASEVNPLEKQTPEEGYYFFNRWADEESAATDPSAGPFSGDCHLVPSRVMPPGQEISKLTKQYPNFNCGSHRRSVSSVTL